MPVKAFAICLFVLQILGCASGYKPESRSGGFTEMQLGDDLYEVRYQGNSFTRRSEASKLLMRRCAELTLEHGVRYFATVGPLVDSTVGEAADPGVHARIRLLERPSDEPDALDAVRIVEETEAVAGGKLSEKARSTIRLFTSRQ
jgi:hypothetical protein